MALLAGGVITGCGTTVATSAGAVQASPSVPVFPKTMNPDGTVPWVSAPVVDPFVTPAPAPPPATGPTCTAGQLRGVLPAWVSGEASNDGGMDPLAAASLHGWVNLTNVSGKPCTLNGVPAVTLLSNGVPVQVSYARFGTDKAVTVGLPAHGAANFRIDWGAPYCPGGAGIVPGPPDPGPFSLRAVIDGVTLDIAVHSTASPACDLTQEEPGVTSSVVTSPMSPGSVTPGPPAPKPSVLRRLRATASGYPSRIAPGQLLRFVITLSNPTGAAVSLTAPPPAGYTISAYCARTPSTPGYQFARPYSLDTGPRPVIPAHGAVRFAMQLAIPTLTCPTARLDIGWLGGPPAFTVGGPQTSFTVAVRG
jgi:Domain of unknown function (DUF4232)